MKLSGLIIAYVYCSVIIVYEKLRSTHCVLLANRFLIASKGPRRPQTPADSQVEAKATLLHMCHTVIVQKWHWSKTLWEKIAALSLHYKSVSDYK